MKTIICLALLSLTISPTYVFALPLFQATQKSCHGFVQGYYDWYTSTAHANFSEAFKSKKEVFSNSLFQKLKEDLEASAHSPGEIVGLDFDPVLNSQDPDSKYIAGEASVKNNICTITVRRKSALKNDPPDVTAELFFKNNQWQFSNFLYTDNKSKKTTNLVSILDALAKDRKSTP